MELHTTEDWGEIIIRQLHISGRRWRHSITQHPFNSIKKSYQFLSFARLSSYVGSMSSMTLSYMSITVEWLILEPRLRYWMLIFDFPVYISNYQNSNKDHNQQKITSKTRWDLQKEHTMIHNLFICALANTCRSHPGDF